MRRRRSPISTLHTSYILELQQEVQKSQVEEPTNYMDNKITLSFTILARSLKTVF